MPEDADSLLEDVEEAMSRLDEQEVDILNSRYGILDSSNEYGETLESVGERYALTRERIRQIENIAMDKLARESAEAMAKSAGCSQLRTTYVGNILRGESIRAVHRATMMAKDGRERANLLNPYFQDFGVGTAKGDDGMLYVCQLFSERLELNCTDVANDSD